MQIVGCIWKTGYNTPLQISSNEHTKRLIRHPSDFKEQSAAEMFSGSYNNSNFVDS